MHDSTRSEKSILPAHADTHDEARDDTRNATRNSTITLARGAIQGVELRRGAAIIAVEGELLIRYRDPTLASLGQIAPELTLRLLEGERHIARERTGYAVSAAQAPGARFMLQAKPGSVGIARIARIARAVWMALSQRLSRAGAWLRGRPQRT